MAARFTSKQLERVYNKYLPNKSLLLFERRQDEAYLRISKRDSKVAKSMSTRGRSSVGRAPALQAGGQEFESLRLH